MKHKVLTLLVLAVLLGVSFDAAAWRGRFRVPGWRIRAIGKLLESAGAARPVLRWLHGPARPLLPWLVRRTRSMREDRP